MDYDSQNEYSNRVILKQLTNATIEGGNNSTNTTQPALPSKGWLGLDSTQLLIVFLIIVFAILSLFLLIYYYVIKGMRQRSISKMGHKSVSGSIGEAKDRNIFAHPERHMAVDQSTRASSHSPNSTSEPESAPTSVQPTPSINQQQPATSTTSTTTGTKQLTASGSNQRASPTVTIAKLSNQPSLSTKTTTSSNSAQRAAITSPPQSQSAASRKSSSESRKRRQQQKQQVADPAEVHDTHSILGTLASLRDTLKETEQHK